MNVVFYLAIAGLVLVIFAYGILFFKVYMGNQKIADIDKKISIYGTQEQKQHEQEVFDYKKKIDDFALLLNGHKISSNIFTFMEAKTVPNVVFLGFTMSQTRSEIRLSGESDTMATLSRQFQVLENSKEYIKSISVLNSQIAPSGKIAFVFNIFLDEKLFDYGYQ